ncbi:substrate-binding domain-containing protein [Rosistilla oblonga]|uniref:AraC family transcriptional regulator n=1 Tax=Rosistilla oblonga TaxID=2527990 RepID=UPI003A97EDA6
MPSRHASTPPPKIPHNKQIALLIDPDDTWGRSVIQGIASAARNVLPWNLWIAPRDDQGRLRVPRNWRGDGIIAAIRDDKTAEHVESMKLPTVIVSSWEQGPSDWHRVNTDDRKRAEMALAHFRQRGLSHFAYYGPPSQRYSPSRGQRFQEVVQQAGFSCDTYRSPSLRRDKQSLQERTLQWLHQAARPLAVFAADPHSGIVLSEVCNAVGFRVPEEIAILVGDTDDLLCEISDPPLSSIVLASEQIGMTSVGVLETLLEGKPVAAKAQFIPPQRVIERQSSEMLAVEDPLFVDALRFIREQAHTGIQVGDVLRVVPISRRSLEQRFKQLLNCTPADEIRRIKLERVKQLLISTENTVEQIAEGSGFCGPAQLCFTFKRHVGLTPIAFRLSSRRGIAP